MISPEQTERLKEAFIRRDDYTASIQTALDWLTDYRNDEPYLFRRFIEAIQSNGWNRAISYGYLVCIWEAYDEAGLLTDEIHDGLEPISEALTGYTTAEWVIRCPGDPQYNHGLAEYVRSAAWAD